MNNHAVGALRLARPDDQAQLVRLWGLLFDEDDAAPGQPWTRNAAEWFARSVDDGDATRFPVIEVAGEIVATAIGTLESGVPNPFSPTGRGARLANVITLPGHRGQGYGTTLVLDVIGWARSLGVDRIDLSATAEGQHIYERAGFVMTSAPRMKLVL